MSIMIAAIMDMFDGKVARKFGDNAKKTNIFGEATDSLCDIINFGFVPAVIITKITFEVTIMMVVLCGLYMFSCLFRLARFSSLKYAGFKGYLGLPITISGPLLSLISLFDNQVLFETVMFVMSCLMISNIKFKKLKIGE
jgi:CDP-diacylglycerol--serine O-phosphatidyltransferase